MRAHDSHLTTVPLFCLVAALLAGMLGGVMADLLLAGPRMAAVPEAAPIPPPGIGTRDPQRDGRVQGMAQERRPEPSALATESGGAPEAQERLELMVPSMVSVVLGADFINETASVDLPGPAREIGDFSAWLNRTAPLALPLFEFQAFAYAGSSGVRSFWGHGSGQLGPVTTISFAASHLGLELPADSAREIEVWLTGRMEEIGRKKDELLQLALRHLTAGHGRSMEVNSVTACAVIGKGIRTLPRGTRPDIDAMLQEIDDFDGDTERELANLLDSLAR